MKKRENLIIIFSMLILLAGTFIYSSITSPKSECVNVYVDYGVLAGGKKVNDCVSVGGTVGALSMLNASGLSILGTDKYGLQIVCRVNSLPSASTPIGIKGHEEYVETCKDMPAEFAYWAIIVRKGSSPWNWSDVGIADLEVKNGDSVGLVFVENENMRFPN